MASFVFTYSREKERVMRAVLIDMRATIPQIAMQTGDVILSYLDSQIAQVTDNMLFYKIENQDNGVLVGYFVLVLSNFSAFLIFSGIRPAYKVFSTQISLQITNFINNGDFKRDYLF